MVNTLLQLTPAMESYLIALIYRNTRTSCLSLAAVCAHISHDRLQRMLYQKFAWSRRLWEWFAASMVREGGYLIDDTAWARWAVQSEAVSWVWSSTHGRTMRGMQVVLLIWTDGRVKVPLGLRLWKKGSYSKVELAAQLLREAERRGMRPEYVLFDSWYAASSLLHVLESLGWKYVARLKSNRLFEGQAVRQRWPHRYGRAVGKLRKVNHQVSVVKDGRRYFVTNDTKLSSSELKQHYRQRQQLEEVFRLLKQEFGWGGASARRARAQVVHLHLGLYALCISEQAARREGQTIYAFKRELFRLPIPEHLPQCDAFSVAA
ncbi:MAG: transposase [Pyrinomonadaceae bacterium]